jgi:hypothetical protein
MSGPGPTVGSGQDKGWCLVGYLCQQCATPLRLGVPKALDPHLFVANKLCTHCRHIRPCLTVKVYKYSFDN